MKELVWILVVVIAGGSSLNAQKELSKRDQKKKAEFEAMIVAEEKYDELMIAADQAFKNKDYVKARMTYEEAIQYNAEKEQWLISKVNDLDILMARNIARKVDSIFVLPKVEEVALDVDLQLETSIEKRAVPAPLPVPKEAEEEVDEPLVEAVKAQQEQPEPDPTEELVKIAEEALVVEPPKEEAAKPVVKKQPVEKVKVKDDFADLPQGMTESEFDYPDHHVWRIVVKDGIDTIVYKRVKHRWGGDFCFKDDVSISQRIWNEEIEVYRKKYPSK